MPTQISAVRGDITKQHVDVIVNAANSSFQHHLTTIAFPSISTGIFGFPLDRAAPIAVGAVRAYLAEHPQTSLTWICFDDRTLAAYQAALR